MARSSTPTTSAPYRPSGCVWPTGSSVFWGRSVPGKIGLTPQRAAGAGSYDATRQLLTLVQYTKPEGATDYVNSMWNCRKNRSRATWSTAITTGCPARCQAGWPVFDSNPPPRRSHSSRANLHAHPPHHSPAGRRGRHSAAWQPARRYRIDPAVGWPWRCLPSLRLGRLGRVDCGAGIVLRLHPPIQFRAQLGQALGLCFVVGKIVHLVGIIRHVIKLLGGRREALDQSIASRRVP